MDTTRSELLTITEAEQAFEAWLKVYTTEYRPIAADRELLMRHWFVNGWLAASPRRHFEEIKSEIGKLTRLIEEVEQLGSWESYAAAQQQASEATRKEGER